jgi:glycosyltransferase involved in cell wall biosynthesis
MYFGTYIPNHGVQHIIEAARLLRDESHLEFELVGDGPEREPAQKLAASYGLANITFIAWLDQPALVARAAHADLILGAFGSTPQSVMTVQNKIYAALAMAKPVITGDSPAVQQALIHGEHIYLCERENPQALAEAICNLQSDTALRARLATSGRQLFTAQFDLLHLGQRFARHLEELARR